MFVYSLTKLTGKRKNLDRTIVVATVELNRRTFLVGVISFAASLPFALLAMMLLGPYSVGAILVPFLFVVGGLYMADQRTRQGLQLHRYEAMWDRHKARDNVGTVFVCSVPLTMAELAITTPQFFEVPAAADAPDAVITTSRRRERGKKATVFA